MSSQRYRLLAPEQQAFAIQTLAQLPLGEGWLVEFRQESEEELMRSAQRRTVWAWHTQLGKERGDSKERRHDLFKFRHVIPIMLRDENIENLENLVDLAKTDKKVFKVVIDLIHTSALTVKQMSEAMNEYDDIWARRGIVFQYRKDTW